jgi:hypothetical protein
MHRSGTSAMAGALSLYGAKGPSNPLPPSGTNTSGYFESEPITQLNDEVLSELDSSWDDIFAGQPKSYISNFDHFYRHKAAELLQAEYSDASGMIVLKDPRINVLVGLWDRALKLSGYAPFYIIMVRHPMEVAHSLRTRDQVPVEQGLLLWLDNMVAAERDTRGSPRIFVTYEDLLNAWSSVVDRIERASGVPMPRRTPAASNKVGLFLSSAKQHHKVDPAAEGQGEFWPRIKQAYAWFYAAAHDDEDQASSETLDALAVELRNFYGFLGSVLSGQQSKVAEFKKHTRGLEELVEHLKHNLGEVEERAERLKNDDRSEINTLTAEIERLVSEIESYRLQTGELAKAEATAQAMKGDIGGLQARERALENEVAEFKKHTRGLEELIEHLKHNLREVEERAEQLQNDNKSEINNLTSEIDRLVREIDSHQLQAGELDKAEATVQALKVDIDELKARERALELERDAARTALVAERAARRAAEEEGEALDRRHLELRNELIRIQALSEETLSRNQRLEDEVRAAQAHEASLSASTARASDELAAAKAESDAARTALVAERAARRAAEEEGEALDRRHLELRNELIRIQALSEEILPRNRRLEDELNSARAVDRVVREELKAAQENEHAVRQALERVFSSRSWKMTSFPRRLITKLKSK